jgi:outer membrane murein-binding lipoprotein Lpp
MFLLSYKQIVLVCVIVSAIFSVGCLTPKKTDTTPTLLKTETAEIKQLQDEVDRYARVSSMRGKMYLKFEDNSFAQFGSKEVYREADGEVVVQRPANILMKVQVPVIKSDVAQMTSDGEKFRVAILNDGGSGKYKKFVMGTNKADYSKLQQNLDAANGDQMAAQHVNAFANLRPQHFTDAMLVRPIDTNNLYTHSTIFQIEEDVTQNKKSPLRKVTRGYYLLDEFGRGDDGTMKITRRFWFDRVGKIRLARQQIFDAKGEISSDIIYGREGDLTTTGDYKNLPLEISVTRPQEKYSMRLRYQTPEDVTIGQTFPPTAFVLQNTWELEVLDLDRKLQELAAARPSNPNANASTRIQH